MLQIEGNHVQLLVETYVENDCASDKLLRNHAALSGFTQEFNRRCGGAYGEDQVGESLEYIRKTKYRTGGLPRVGRRYAGPHFVDN